jgi:hypothetical protein
MPSKFSSSLQCHQFLYFYLLCVIAIIFAYKDYNAVKIVSDFHGFFQFYPSLLLAKSTASSPLPKLSVVSAGSGTSTVVPRSSNHVLLARLHRRSCSSPAPRIDFAAQVLLACRSSSLDRRIPACCVPPALKRGSCALIKVMSKVKIS